MITVQVMAFSQVSAHDHDAISPLPEGIDNELRMDHARAHDPDDPDVGWILHPGSAGKIGCRI